MSDVTWSRVRSARKVDLEDPDPDDILLTDIAYSLARQYRFNGHVPCSVAEHSMHVALLAPDSMMLEGLLHDAAEAYVGDVTLPVRNLISGYEEIHDRVERAVAQSFGLDHPWPEEIDRFDHIATQTEANRAWGNGNYVDIGLGRLPGLGIEHFRLARGPDCWQAEFMHMFACCRDGSFDRIRSRFVKEES